MFRLREVPDFVNRLKIMIYFYVVHSVQYDMFLTIKPTFFIYNIYNIYYDVSDVLLFYIT